MTASATSLDRLAINTLRTLAIDAVQKAASGHPGLPLGAAPMAWMLWSRFLKHDPADPGWPDRDRFVLSAGHGSMLLYALLHLFGYGLTLDDLKAFRQWGSRTPGHPEHGLTPGVEATTGPLGQGASNSVGMAIAERALAHRFNRDGHRLVDHYTYALVSDGDLMEGISYEAAALAGHLRLGRLIWLYDSNDVTLDGPLSMSSTGEDVARRFEAERWHVQQVDDGDHDVDGIAEAIDAARAEEERPSLVIVRTTIGYGSPKKAGSHEAHGAPLGKEEVAATKRALGWDPEAFFDVPDEVRLHVKDLAEAGRRAHEEWSGRRAAFARSLPDLDREWSMALEGRLPAGLAAALPAWKPGVSVATRTAGGAALNALAGRVPWLLGGDGDLSSSTKTAIKDGGAFEGAGGSGRNIHFGVREHAMAGIVNGIAYHGGLRPFASTFLVFSDYMRPSVRLAALAGLPVIYVWTHDSIAVGEDGPTHEPVEHLMALRAIPGFVVIRPADATETAEAWIAALEHAQGPVALVLSRQDLPVLDRSGASPGAGVARGAYVLRDAAGGPPQAIVMATGSEVALALRAQERLAGEGIRARVVSMPSWELFEAQAPEYRESVLPARIRARVSVEAGTSFGWSRFLGDHGFALALDRFGASAPGEVNLEKLGFTAENVAAAVRAALAR